LENNNLLKQYENLKLSLLYYRGELADILEMINDQLNLKVKLQVKILFLDFLNFKLWELKLFTDIGSQPKTIYNK